MQNETETLYGLLQKIWQDGNAVIPLLFKYLFIFPRDKYKTDISTLTSIPAIRNANNDPIYCNGLSQILCAVSKSKSIQILYPFSPDHNKFNCCELRSKFELSDRLEAILEDNPIIHFLSRSDLAGTDNEHKSFLFYLRYPAHAICVDRGFRFEPLVINLTSKDSGIEADFRSDGEFLKHFLILAAMSAELGKNIIQLQDAQYLTSVIGTNCMLDIYSSNLYIVSISTIQCCSEIEKNLFKLLEQCNYASRTSDTEEVYRPMSTTNNASKIKLSEDWKKNNKIAKEIAYTILERINITKVGAYRLMNILIAGHMLNAKPANSLTPPPAPTQKLAPLAAQYSAVFTHDRRQANDIRQQNNRQMSNSSEVDTSSQKVTRVKSP